MSTDHAVDDCQKKAAELGFDLTKQFLTLAFAGIAFVVGLSFNTPGSISSLMLWLVIAAFGLSAALGLFFLMHGVNLLGVKKTYDIYASSLRFLATLQIVLMLAGTGLLIPVLNSRPSRKISTPTHSMEIRLNNEQSLTYPLDSSKSVVVEVNGGRVKISEANN
jgi:hypothetical protein